MRRRATGGLLLALTMLAWRPSIVLADCEGEMRDTTQAEKAAWDQASKIVPGLFHPPSDYKLERREVTVPRNLRCVAGGHDPLFLPVHLRFVLQGQALEEVNRQALRLESQQQQVMQKYLTRTMPLQAELTKHLQSFPPSPEDQQAADRIGRRIDAIVAEQKRELAPLQRKMDRLQARREIKVEVDFNTGSGRCSGNSVRIPNATAACLEDFEDGGAILTVLMGAWTRGEDGWQAGFDPAAPDDRMQNMTISITAAGGDVMNAMREHADWQGLAALLGDAQ